MTKKMHRIATRLRSHKSRASTFWMLVVLLVALPRGQAASAQDLSDERGPLPTLEITPGASRGFKAAVLRFHMVGPPVGEERIDTLRKEIEKGLAFSTVVQPLDREAYLASDDSPSIEAGGIDCDAWKQSGADALLFGEVKRDGSRLRTDIRIMDVGRCHELMSGKVIGDRDGLAKLGRRIADEAVGALTGLRGVASTEIAFISDRSGNRELYVMSADGRDERPATGNRTLKMFPEWTPDGGAILYSNYSGIQPSFSLASRSKDIPAGPILSELMPGRPKYRGRFDPTGDELAMVSSVDGSAEIFRVKRKGKKSRRLTNHPAIDISPSWSPDGKQIVFCSDRSGAPQLYVMDRNGGNIRRLTYTGAYNAAPAWSPDGRWIAYETRVRGQFDIWLIDPTGQINFPIVQHGRSDEGASWSPDGRKIVFSSSRRGRYDLYVMDWNGENLARLTARSGKNIQPDWGPHSK
jgi:TolB protein